MSLAPGTRLGSYVIVELLGSGGMGEVYLAKDTRLPREVAIKVLPADVASDPDRLARFEREAHAVSTLNHPHIVTLYEVGTSEAGPYLVLEKVDGRSLRDVLNDGPMPVRRVLTLGAQIAEGLAKAHSVGIVHRDLKPANVMVTADGFAKILDFGLAKLVWPELDTHGLDAATTIAKDTESGIVLGTVGYLSPEQAAGKPVDYRADQFALGALLYEMATRVRPFKRSTLVESLAATISDDVEPLRSKRPDAPAPLEWLIDRCLSKEPRDRYASTSDLARELASLRDHLSDLTRMPSGEMPASTRPQRRWISRAALAGLAVAIAAIGYAAAKLTTAPTTATELSFPSYQPLTFRRGSITGARFAPDGKTIYYSATYGDGPSRVYRTHVDRTESDLLDFVPPGFLLGVSAKQELAVLRTTARHTLFSPGTIVRVPTVGGTPRPVAGDATFGGWAPDSEQLAIVRADGSCEFPIGQRIAPGCGSIQVSPKGDKVAAVFAGALEVHDLSGRLVAKTDMSYVLSIAWSPDGQEVWFTGSENNSATDRAIYALDLKGNRRLVARMPGAMTIYDVALDGSALISTGSAWIAVNAGRVDRGPELELDLLGRSSIVGLSADGRWLLTDEEREVGKGTYLQSTDGKDRTPFLGYKGLGLSPDGASVLVRPIGKLNELKLISRETGTSRDLPIPAGLQLIGSKANWSGDGRRLFTWLRPQQPVDGAAPARLYMREGDGEWQPVTPPMPGPGLFAVSRDGRAVAVTDPDGTVTIDYPDGAPPRRLDGERGRPIHWSDDSRVIYFQSGQQFPNPVYRRHLATNRVEPWRTVGPSDPVGVTNVSQVFIAQGEQSYVYQYSRYLGDLFLARGLR